LARWLRDVHAPETVAAILESLREHPSAERDELLAAAVADRTHTSANRLAALTLLVDKRRPDEPPTHRVSQLAAAVEGGPGLAALLRHLGRQAQSSAAPLMLSKLDSSRADVRAAAIEALGELRVPQAADASVKLLNDDEAIVRTAAASAAGALLVQKAIDPLL